MAPLYKPPTRVVTVQVPYLAMVTRADPDFQRDKFRQVEYEFSSGKRYLANPYVRGSYNRLGNTYAVGQPQGAPDPLITAALTTTAGVETPGLFSGTPTGGWS